eukprot:jgi/Mesvir1/1258/Mv24120-RA.1
MERYKQKLEAKGAGWSKLLNGVKLLPWVCKAVRMPGGTAVHLFPPDQTTDSPSPSAAGAKRPRPDVTSTDASPVNSPAHGTQQAEAGTPQVLAEPRVRALLADADVPEEARHHPARVEVECDAAVLAQAPPDAPPSRGDDGQSQVARSSTQEAEDGAGAMQGVPAEERGNVRTPYMHLWDAPAVSKLTRKKQRRSRSKRKLEQAEEQRRFSSEFGTHVEDEEGMLLQASIRGEDVDDMAAKACKEQLDRGGGGKRWGGREGEGQGKRDYVCGRLALLEGERLEMGMRLEVAELECANLMEENAKMKEEYARMKEECAQARASQVEMRREMGLMEAQVLQLRGQNAALQSQSEVMRGQMEELQAHNMELRGRLDILQGLVDDAEKNNRG